MNSRGRMVRPREHRAPRDLGISKQQAVLGLACASAQCGRIVRPVQKTGAARGAEFGECMIALALHVGAPRQDAAERLNSAAQISYALSATQGATQTTFETRNREDLLPCYAA